MSSLQRSRTELTSGLLIHEGGGSNQFSAFQSFCALVNSYGACAGMLVHSHASILSYVVKEYNENSELKADNPVSIKEPV